ncbi:MAG: DNA polymerase III subunit alpha [Treponema sp.]|nr:DNA polymerase III subunit alpha [Treponema sp.]
MANFVHLHVHSDYSLADGAVSIKSLVERAGELEMGSIALTDHGNLFGAMEFIEICKKNDKKVKPIIGCEVYVSPGLCTEKKGAEHENKYYHMVLLAQTREGYFNLVKICSYAYTEGFYYRPRIDNEILKKYHKGLIALSACASGEIPRLIQAGKLEEAEKRALFYRDLFGFDDEGKNEPCFYLEIQDHGIPSGGLRGTDLSQKDINIAVAGISKKTGIPLVATNDVHYLNQDDSIAHDILLCIGTAKLRTDENRKRYHGDQFYLKSGDEMSALFNEYPQAVENTVRIADRCNADIPDINIKELPKYLPEVGIPEGFDDADSYLRHLAKNGLEQRYAKEKVENGNEWENIKKRCEEELNIIIDMGFTGYFLIVEDFIRYAKNKDIPVGPGRGSGVGSIVAYSLRITDVEPLKYNLLFERFLHNERVSMPDFDIDFANFGRDDVRNYVTEKYGKDKVGKIITFSTLGTKQVIKDVARVLNISLDRANMILKLIPEPKGQEKLTLKYAFENESKLRELENESAYAEMFQIARKLEGLKRNSSIHAAGIVIGKYPLIELVPLYQERDDAKTGKPGAIATQFSMNYLEQCGLVKMDFLGLITLDVIRHTEELIHLQGGKYANFFVKDMPENDKKAYKMLGEGRSYGIFQFESDGMQGILKRTKPNSIADLSALNAMYRPGPMDNIDRFVESKNGRQPITYPDPSLENILKETYGVIVYQEQVMEVAKIIAGYSMGKADLLRRAMGKKKRKIIDEEKIPFLEGAAKQGYSREKADEIYEILVPFADYGFNKSHAVAYSVLAYQTAYLKANFPAEFMAANLTNDIYSTDKDRLSKCIDETRRMGLTVEPPNINHSNKVFTVVNGKIIYGFLGIKGVGESPCDEIVKKRQDSPYKSFMDFLERVNIKAVGKKVIELLIQTGAFDDFGVSRETLEGNLEKTVEYALKKKEDEQLGQSGLFDDISKEDMPEFKFEEFPPKSRSDRLNLEKQLIGFYFSGHPMDEYKKIWQEAVTVNLGKRETWKTGNYILVGIIKDVKTIITSKGGKMAFASLSDFNGEIEVTFFSDPWERCQHHINEDRVVILKGKIDYQRDKDKYSFLADSVISRQEAGGAVNEIKDLEEKNKIHRNTWLYMADLKSSFLNQVNSGNYTVIGYLTSLREIKDKNQNDMAFGALKDFEGEIDLLFFSKVYAEYRHLLKVDEIYAFKGKWDPDDKNRDGKCSFKVTSMADFPMLTKSAAKKAASKEKAAEPDLVKTVEYKPDEVHIRLNSGASENNEELTELRDYLADNSGRNAIFIHIPLKEEEKIIRAMSGLDIGVNDDIIEGLRKCKSVAEVWRA